MSQPTVSIAILSWNGRHHLEICLPAVFEQQLEGGSFESRVEVLVLDNGSSDGTAEWLRTQFPKVRLIESPVNLGFCAGNNRLVEAAGGEWVVLLNNDTRPCPGWLACLVDALAGAPDDVAAVSGKIVDWTGKRLDFGRGLLTFDGHAFQQDYGRLLDRAEVPATGSELLFPCGGNMIVRKAVYEELGGFDEDYFAYLEDVDLGWRIWAAGWRVLFAPEAVVHHRSMATSQLLGNHNRGFLFERNAYLTAYKNFDEAHWARMMPGVLLTLQHRTQTLLVQNNPGGAELAVNPYDGLIADTGQSNGGQPQLQAPVETIPHTTWAQKWRGYGPSEFFRRAARKATRMALPGWIFETPQLAEPQVQTSSEGVRLEDPRTVAQLRALSYLWSHLDDAAARRRTVQAHRRRSDQEIFERFPLYVVPTYPGDETLFSSPAFQSWMPSGVPLVERRLDQIMEL